MAKSKDITEAPKTPTKGEKGVTDRFVACNAAPWSHPEEPSACRVRWSWNKKLHFFATCPVCRTRSFLNDWRVEDGYNVVEAESQGLKPYGLKRGEKEILLRELGLRPAAPTQYPVPPPPRLPPPIYRGPPQPPRMRLVKKSKKSKK